MKEIKDGINREIFHVPEPEESIMWKWQYYQMQSTYSMQSLSKAIFTELEQQKKSQFIWKHKYAE